MNDLCANCGKVKVWRSPPAAIAYQECPRCTQPVIKLPKTKHKTSRTAAVIKDYHEAPLSGEDGDTYYVENMKAVIRWDKEKQDYQILQLTEFHLERPADEFNNRREAILSQRARKSHNDKEE